MTRGDGSAFFYIVGNYRFFFILDRDSNFKLLLFSVVMLAALWTPQNWGK